jgi:hypothetical protein
LTDLDMQRFDDMLNPPKKTKTKRTRKSKDEVLDL